MNILHVLWGFSPWREGGLVLYADDIMEAQLAHGHSVAAFFPGRRKIWEEPCLSRWSKGALHNYEIRNSQLVHLGNRGTFPPEWELGEPLSERFFCQVIEEFRPNVVHIHELAGLPFTLIDICKQHCIPLVLTLHDYFPLCPTLNLYGPQGVLCSDTLGSGCVECCRRGTDWGLRDRFRTVTTEGGSKWLYAGPLLLRYVWDFLLAGKGCRNKEQVLENIYRERRILNLARLRSADVIIAQSYRTKQIYEERTGRRDIRVAHSTPSHIESLTPRKMSKIMSPVRFATLNGALTPHKGAELIRDCVNILRDRGYEGGYRLEIFGDIYRPIKCSLLSTPSVLWRGKYNKDDLNRILADVDIGIVPSMWEEVYGYVGIEFLANGIPVIGNRRGGIVDYTLNGCTGWVNDACTAEGLADIMERIINDPDCILPLNQWIVDNRDKVIVDRKEHLSTVLKYYEQAIAMCMDGGK